MEEDSEDASPKVAVTRQESRSAARLAAVQALYQMDLTQRDLGEVLAEFLLDRFEAGETNRYHGADRAFFRDIVTGAVERQTEIDQEAAVNLAEGWRLSRLDSILRAVLRAGIFELMSRRDVPARVVINEYVELSRDFFSGEEPGVVNGVLDRIARARRTEEFVR